MSRQAPEFFCKNKRRLYPLFLLTPATPLAAFFIWQKFGEPEFWAYLTPFVVFVCVPLLDWLIGRDQSNPEPGVVARLRHDFWLNTWPPLAALIVIGSVFWGGYVFVFTPWNSLAGAFGWILSMGIVSGVLGINVAHELIHKPARWRQLAGGVLLSLVSYGSFKVEHLRGHHRWVATPEDPSSATRNESLYAFIVRAAGRNILNGWRLEAVRLRSAGRAWYSPHNELLWWTALSLAVASVFFTWLGPRGLLYFFAQSVVAVALLETVNYIEHYGLKRRREPSGRYEAPGLMHSWNSDHLLTNLLLFQLQRHSDHHIHPRRTYQELESSRESPRLPAGYATMILLAMVPPLWRHFINPRLPA